MCRKENLDIREKADEGDSILKHQERQGNIDFFKPAINFHSPSLGGKTHTNSFSYEPTQFQYLWMTSCKAANWSLAGGENSMVSNVLACDSPLL